MIAANLNWPTQLWNIVQWDISSTKLYEPLLTCLISHNTFPIHCTNLFLRFSYVLSFFETIKHNMLKMLFSPILNIKMAIQKFTNIDKLLKNCMLIWLEDLRERNKKFKRTEIISNILPDHNSMKLEIHYRKKMGKTQTTWRLNHMLLKNQ